ncbi:MAG: hypothetical protein PWP52_1973 [Bacteroidales bacterium]|jgi:hypothetical protein|nr:hypothetical protein [Bacteroidales bacterium]
MDDIFDSLIYILITLAAFAISLMGKKKKPAQRRPDFSEQGHSKSESTSFVSDFDRLFEDHDEPLGSERVEPSFFGEKKPPQDGSDNQENKNQFNNEILDSVPEESLDKKEKMPYSIDYDDNHEMSSNKPLEVEDLTENEGESVLDDFDLEKAVIYSEILHRKEY